MRVDDFSWKSPSFAAELHLFSRVRFSPADCGRSADDRRCERNLWSRTIPFIVFI